MRTLIRQCLILVSFLSAFNMLSAATLSGTYTLPGTVGSTTINNLTDLSTMLNGGTNTISGQVIFEFTSAYTTAPAETFPIIFTAFTGTGNVVIRPAASVNTSLVTAGAPAGVALVNFNGGRYFTIDGRAGGAGTTSFWQFKNTAVAGSYPAISYTNGSSYDTLSYLSILSSGSSSTATILLGTSTVAGGNSYNSINNCSIGNNAGYPYNPILSSGTAGNANSNTSIVNNNIYNFQTYNNNSPNYAGINISATGNGSNWTITGNSIYSNINPLSLGGYTYHGVYLNAGASSTGNVISGNYIGGQQPLCAGPAWQVPAYGANGYGDFDGIYVAAGATTIANNTIKNIYMASRYGSSTFRGICVVSGTATVTDNVIGNTTTGDSIISGLYGTMIGIQNQSTSTVTINHNTIGNFVSDGRSYVSGTSGTTTGVTIGIFAYSSSAVVGANTITNNTIANFSRKDNYNNNLYFPVNAGGGSSVTGQNIIYQMDIIAGICVQTVSGSQQIISKNKIYNLFNTLTGATNKTYINGIVDYAGTGGSIVNGNLIYGLYAPDNFGGSGYYTGLNGIYIPASSLGTNTITNNMIALGYRPDGSSIQNALISGIWDNTQTNNTSLKIKCYHNSVYIGGSNTNAFSNNLNSYAFRRVLTYGSSVYDSLVFKNNIFVNNRSNTTGTAINYGIYLNATTDVAADYNDIYGTGTGFMFGHVGSNDFVNLAVYKATNTGFETNSISADPAFVSPATGTPDLHVASATPIDQAGTATATLVYDFDSLVRANYSPVDIGASVNCSAVAPTVTLTVPQDTVCTGTPIVFTASVTSGGTAPVYTFYKNGVLVQSGTSATYTITGPANNDSVSVILTSNAGCVTTTTATSNTIIITVTNNTVTPTVSLSTLQNNVCSGIPVSFNTVVTNAGTTPVYNFLVNGTSVQNGASASYSSTGLHNGDSVWVVLTSNAACLSTTTATSNKVYMQITPSVTPTASISASQTTICAGTQIIFTAASTNGGTSPTYTFYRNGAIVQTGAPNTYTSSSLSNNDSVWVVVNSNATCASPASVTSTKLHITVGTTVTPTISINTTTSAICTGATVAFTSSITNGGLAPAYQWKKNGSNVATGASYSTNGFVNGDVITCVLTSNAACVVPDSAVSNAITITVSGTVVPTITIAPTGPLSVCAGTGVSFNATITNGGNTPAYAWKKNGIAAGSNLSSYTDATPVNGDVISCVLTSSSGCASPTTATSNADTITVYQAASSSFNHSICAGSTYNFNGQALNAAGNYTETLTTVYGCDSVVTLHLTLTQTLTSSFSHSICGGSYPFNGQQLTASGAYNDTLLSSTGCDSIVTLHLTVASNLATTINQNICSGSSYVFNGQTLTTGGTYIDTLTSTGGCDSVITLHLSVQSGSSSSLNQIICSGTSYNFNGHAVFASGTYNDTITAGQGCDSIITLHLTVSPSPDSSFNQTICDGSNYIFNGQTLTNAGVYRDTVTSSIGCDSVVTLHLFTQNFNDSALVNGAVCTIQGNIIGTCQWINCVSGIAVNGATSPTFVATQNGSYACVVGVNSCFNTTNCVSVTSLDIEALATYRFDIYPNPTTGIFKITHNYPGVLHIQITDHIGQIVREFSMADKSALFDMSPLAQGIYFVRVLEAEQQISVTRLVKQ